MSFALACSAGAQDSGGLNASLSVSQTLRYSTNDGFGSGDGTFRAQTDLGFSLSSQTRTDGLTLQANSGLYVTGDDFEIGIKDPSLSLAYQRTSKRSDFTARLSYRTLDLGSYIASDEDDLSLTILDNGTRKNVDGSVALVFGKDMPLGGTVSLSRSSVDYEDVADPDLVDSVTTSLASQVNLKIDHRITGRVTASWSELDQDVADRVTIVGGVGADFLVNKNLTVGADLTYNVVETTNATSSSTNEGWGASVNATQRLPDGSISGEFRTGFNQNGRESSVNISGQRQLKNGTLGASIGGTLSDDSDFAPLYGLSYSTELVKGGMLSAKLTQSFNVANDGAETVATNMNVSYQTALTRVSNISTAFTFRDSKGVNVDGEDASRMDLSVRYRHELARDWGLVGGYTYSYATEDGQDDRSTNTVFVGLDKTFNWHP